MRRSSPLVRWGHCRQAIQDAHGLAGQFLGCQSAAAAALAAASRVHTLLLTVETIKLATPGAGCTLDDDGDSFWSSTGSQSPEACEYLLYKLK